MSINNLQENPGIWCVIPVFNNKDTVKEVALGCRKYLKHILVVDDGSNDTDIQQLFNQTDIQVLRHPKNLGKGQAIRTALNFIQKHNGEFMITVDADGQHYPEDLNKFIPLLENDSTSIIIGCRNFRQKSIPEKSQFGRVFSNFWLRLETGVALTDTQSGFRSYPVRCISGIKTRANYYDFETEILVRACWAGLSIKEVEIQVFYPKPEYRISNFNPFIDNLRISLMHIRLLGRRLVPLPYPKVIPAQETVNNISILRHPVKLLKHLLKENATPLGLAISAGTGILLGTLPLVSVHMLAILYVTSRLHLNKIMALSIQNLCMPPFVPLACIELGHFMIYRKWITDVSWQATFGSIPQRIWEWLLGSLILAPIFALIIGIIIYLIARSVQERINRHAQY